MDEVDVAIIGAGVVGLAIARHLSRNIEGELVVIEKHGSFGRETSSRNSEVLHAGLYYPRESLKASSCVRGNRLCFELCRRYGIKYQQVGKIIIGSGEEEINRVHQLYRQGRENGVEHLHLLSRRQLKDLEPGVEAEEGLLSSDTGIIDSHMLMDFFEREARHNGVIMAYGCELQGLDTADGIYRLEIRDADGESMILNAAVLINTAGLQANKVMAMAGLDASREGLMLHFCKGEYFSVASRHQGKVKRLIYPVPTSFSLGIHTVTGLDGRLKLGPNAFYVRELDYDVDMSHVDEFYEQACRYLTFIEPDDLTPDMSGIRPKLQGPDDGFRDFVVREEKNRGLPGFINLVGIESPGLTAAPALAELVGDLVKEAL